MVQSVFGQAYTFSSELDCWLKIVRRVEKFIEICISEVIGGMGALHPMCQIYKLINKKIYILLIIVLWDFLITVVYMRNISKTVIILSIYSTTVHTEWK